MELKCNFEKLVYIIMYILKGYTPPSLEQLAVSDVITIWSLVGIPEAVAVSLHINKTNFILFTSIIFFSWKVYLENY